jgi:hypothetical protein
MSIWFVIPEDRLADFRAAYLGQHVRGVDAPDIDEQIAGMVPGTNAAEESVLMTGSSRITSTQADNLGVSHASWLQVFTEFPPEDAWKPMEQEHDQ